MNPLTIMTHGQCWEIQSNANRGSTDSNSVLEIKRPGLPVLTLTGEPWAPWSLSLTEGILYIWTAYRVWSFESLDQAPFSWSTNAGQLLFVHRVDRKTWVTVSDGEVDLYSAGVLEDRFVLSDIPIRTNVRADQINVRTFDGRELDLRINGSKLEWPQRDEPSSDRSS
jgi:hypothetical protein